MIIVLLFVLFWIRDNNMTTSSPVFYKLPNNRSTLSAVSQSQSEACKDCCLLHHNTICNISSSKAFILILICRQSLWPKAVITYYQNPLCCIHGQFFWWQIVRIFADVEMLKLKLFSKVKLKWIILRWDVIQLPLLLSCLSPHIRGLHPQVGGSVCDVFSCKQKVLPHFHWYHNFSFS